MSRQSVPSFSFSLLCVLALAACSSGSSGGDDGDTRNPGDTAGAGGTAGSGGGGGSAGTGGATGGDTNAAGDSATGGDAATGCSSAPCYAGVACTNEPGQTPPFSCGPCPSGFSGDGITCTEDGPAVVSTVPDSGATIRFDSSAFAAMEINRFIVTFDTDVFEVGIPAAPLMANINHLDSAFTETLDIDPRSGVDLTILRFVPSTTSITALPAGNYEITLQNVRSHQLTTLPSYTWDFVAETCGDGVCQPEESTCTCAADCTACAGCCSAYDGAALPHQGCRAGTANGECGINGATCGVCLLGDTCVAGGCQ